MNFIGWCLEGPCWTFLMALTPNRSVFHLFSMPPLSAADKSPQTFPAPEVVLGLTFRSPQSTSRCS